MLQQTATLCVTDDGTVSYTTRYKQINIGYKWGLYSHGVAPSKVPKRIRQIAQSGIGIRDWGAKVTYFASAAQDVGKLQVQNQSPYFRLDTSKMYLRERAPPRQVEDSSNVECKRLLIAVSDGDRSATALWGGGNT